MTPMFRRSLVTHAPSANLIIRLMVGGIFLFEGMQKFLYPGELGSGRFAKIGIPAPEFFGPFVGFFELVCGLLLLIGLCTRVATLPLIITMLVALVTVKIPILIGAEFMGFALRPLPRYGFLSMMHEARNDIAMLLGSLYLLITGAGPWSVDAKLSRS
jgi:uncharacterized membrane protein YphA (DoxX/SURF4 family)